MLLNMTMREGETKWLEDILTFSLAWRTTMLVFLSLSLHTSCSYIRSKHLSRFTRSVSYNDWLDSWNILLLLVWRVLIGRERRRRRKKREKPYHSLSFSTKRRECSGTVSPWGNISHCVNSERREVSRSALVVLAFSNDRFAEIVSIIARIEINVWWINIDEINAEPVVIVRIAITRDTHTDLTLFSIHLGRCLDAGMNKDGEWRLICHPDHWHRSYF